MRSRAVGQVGSGSLEVEDGRMMQKVAVIGASAAGLFTAYLLARKGQQVQVF